MLKLSKKLLNNKNWETTFLFKKYYMQNKFISKLINYSINICQNCQSITITLLHFGFDIKIISWMTFQKGKKLSGKGGRPEKQLCRFVLHTLLVFKNKK
jgi:hypothetical protein